MLSRVLCTLTIRKRCLPRAHHVWHAHACQHRVSIVAMCSVKCAVWRGRGQFYFIWFHVEVHGNVQMQCFFGSVLSMHTPYESVGLSLAHTHTPCDATLAVNLLVHFHRGGTIQRWYSC